MAAIGKSFFGGDATVWAAMVTAAFDMAKTGFEIALGLTGMMCLWLGVMKLGESGGAIDLIARLAGPLLVRLFPGVPPGHPAMGAMILAVMTRVALGHTGRSLVLPRGVAPTYGLVHLAALARVAASLVPSAAPLLLAVSAATWTASFTGFLLLYFPILTAPRADGRPG